jgi:hypothetical protein
MNWSIVHESCCILIFLFILIICTLNRQHDEQISKNYYTVNVTPRGASFCLGAYDSAGFWGIGGGIVTGTYLGPKPSVIFGKLFD